MPTRPYADTRWGRLPGAALRAAEREGDHRRMALNRHTTGEFGRSVRSSSPQNFARRPGSRRVSSVRSRTRAGAGGAISTSLSSGEHVPRAPTPLNDIIGLSESLARDVRGRQGQAGGIPAGQPSRGGIFCPHHRLSTSRRSSGANGAGAANFHLAGVIEEALILAGAGEPRR